MRTQRSIYVKPWLEDGKLVGWTWEILDNGKVIDHGRSPLETISVAREEAVSTTQTGPLVDWDAVWNGGGEEWQDVP